jgi:3-hydroxyacyl-CoA dehydrogenase/enoyl-CoA hydratase/3-hydroxybutyryl-CoA epimerase
VGPIALLDEVGLDVADRAATVLHDAFGDRLAPAPAVGRLAAAGRLGRKSSGGFFRYEDGRRRGADPAALELIAPQETASAPTESDVQRRPVVMMLNEAARALAEGVVRSPRDGDIGAVMGIGFPPFLGGPFRFIDDLGAAALVGELERFAGRLGPRFAPADLLVDMARDGRTFYD